MTFKIGPSLTVDLRDNDFSPSRGVWINTEATFAVGEARPPLPATGLAQAQFQSFSFAKIEGTVIAHIPLFGAVLTMTAKAGHAAAIDGDGVPVDERFLLGGRDTLRGFVEDTLVPEDGCITDPADTPGCVVSVPVVSGIPLSRGGHTFVLLRTELRVPITESFSIDLFADLGNLWWQAPTLDTARPRIGIGAGLRYDTAIGALVADFGINPNPRFGETTFEPHFSVSRF